MGQSIAGGLRRLAWLTEENARLRQLLTMAASNGHVLMKHPPYGSSFLDCDLGPCNQYRSGLDQDRPATAAAPADAGAGETE